jgi:hypothetical protein
MPKRRANSADSRPASQITRLDQVLNDSMTTTQQGGNDRMAQSVPFGVLLEAVPYLLMIYA